MMDSTRLEASLIHQLVLMSTMDSKRLAGDEIRQRGSMALMMERRVVFSMYLRKAAKMCQTEDECRWMESTQLVDRDRSTAADMSRRAVSCVGCTR
jgi:hypothetical protein